MATSTPRPSVSRLISGDGIAVLRVQRDIGAEAPRNRQPLGVRIDADDQRGALELGAERGAQADRALREDRHGVADSNVAALRTATARSRRCPAEHDLFVGQARPESAPDWRARPAPAGIRPRRH